MEDVVTRHLWASRPYLRIRARQVWILDSQITAPVLA